MHNGIMAGKDNGDAAKRPHSGSERYSIICFSPVTGMQGAIGNASDFRVPKYMASTGFVNPTERRFTAA